MARLHRCCTQPTCSQRLAVGLLAVLWFLTGIPSAESAALQPPRGEAATPAETDGGRVPSLVQRAAETLNWLAPLVTPAPLPRFFPN